MTQDPRTLLASTPEWLLSFTIIIGVNLEPQFELELSDLLWKGDIPTSVIVHCCHGTVLMIPPHAASDNDKKSPDIPLITVRNSGFIGRVRTQYREHCSERL